METEILMALLNLIVNLSPEIIAGVFIFIISERHRVNLENQREFKESKIKLLIYIDSLIHIIVSENINDGNEKDILSIRENIRKLYSEIEGLSILLRKRERNFWKRKFTEIRDDVKIFALINTIGIHNNYTNGIKRSDQVEKLKMILNSGYSNISNIKQFVSDIKKQTITSFINLHHNL
jgi:hypothetical protein